jgi:peptidoglycan/LPS O-acetylase OafA/YrhL
LPWAEGSQPFGLKTGKPRLKHPLRVSPEDDPARCSRGAVVKPERGSEYIPTLDGWRAIAIAGVMLTHGFQSLFYPAGPYPSYEALKLIQVGTRGVDVFFAISGFLICSRLLRERETTGRISLTAFYLRRAFRILPPYFVYLAVVAVLAGVGVLAVEPREFVACLLFVRNYVQPADGHGWYTGHYWSLSVEEHFYLFWPLFLIALGSRRARPVAVVLALLVPVWTAVGTSSGWIPVNEVGARTDTRLDALIWGCWAALMRAVPAYRAWIARWLRPWVWLALVIALAVNVRFEPPFGATIQSVLMPWLLVGTALHANWWVSRLLEAGWIRWVGRLSYSLYIWQQLWLMGSWKVTRPFPLGWCQELPLSILCAFASAALSYYLIEKPALRLGRRLTEGRSKRSTRPAPVPELAHAG